MKVRTRRTTTILHQDHFVAKLDAFPHRGINRHVGGDAERNERINTVFFST